MRIKINNHLGMDEYKSIACLNRNSLSAHYNQCELTVYLISGDVTFSLDKTDAEFLHDWLEDILQNQRDYAHNGETTE